MDADTVPCCCCWCAGLACTESGWISGYVTCYLVINCELVGSNEDNKM